MIGRILDKYELLEEVGQGGMAVVYRGRDMSLKREVAVKVLHPHLADSPEARIRFEREAQAVAKLRHANILEIYDYSGPDSPESFIVTEFIEGQTLKDFITKHPPAYPEIGVMIVHELGRALEHAHREGVLHRDIKPENVMIRRDGALKLMDFGIAQILDAQRMTVTGQLLGSPAYMSPEHVEGRQLDFRTDVFSVGIVLYQLITGEPPFRGKNPHEVLKKIGECKVLDPRQKNPLVGGRLARVCLKCLAREPVERYQDVASLCTDLEGVLTEAEITDVPAELHRHFANPASYEMALRVRLVAALTRRGHDELAVGRTAAALEHWNRVLTLDPANEEVKLALARLGRRRRFTRAAMGALAIVLVSGATAGAWTLAQRAERARKAAAALLPDGAPVTVAISPRGPDAARAVVVRPSAVDAAVASARPDAAPRIATPRPPVDAARVPGISTPVVPRTFQIASNPLNVRYRVDDGAFQQATDRIIEVTVGAGPHTVSFENERCVPWSEAIAADARPVGILRTRCAWRPAQIKAVCPKASAIFIDGKPAPNGATINLTDLGTTGKRSVLVEFNLPEGVKTTQVPLEAGGDTVVAPCNASSPP